MHAIIIQNTCKEYFSAYLFKMYFSHNILSSVYIVSSFEIVFKYINATINRQINNTFAAAAPFSPKWNVWKDIL